MHSIRSSNSPDESTVATFNLRSHYGSPDDTDLMNNKMKNSTYQQHRSNERGSAEDLVEVCEHN